MILSAFFMQEIKWISEVNRGSGVRQGMDCRKLRRDCSKKVDDCRKRDVDCSKKVKWDLLRNGLS